MYRTSKKLHSNVTLHNSKTYGKLNFNSHKNASFTVSMYNPATLLT